MNTFDANEGSAMRTERASAPPQRCNACDWEEGSVSSLVKFTSGLGKEGSSMHRMVGLVFVAVAVASSPAYSRSRAFDVQHSKMVVHVYKQGMFSFLADDHEVNAPIRSGAYDSVDKVVELTVDATKMRVLDPKLPTQKRDSVQANMAGTQVLDVKDYPTISFRSSKIDDADQNRWTVTGNLTLRGQTHPISVQVLKTDATHLTGSATIRQTDFGITPIRIAGGAVSVKDDVHVEFEIALEP